MRKITKIEIITRASKLEELKEALNKIGVVVGFEYAFLKALRPFSGAP